MNLFSYLGVLVSVIMGLAITELLGGLRKVIQYRRNAETYWPHIVWNLNVFIYIIAIWWGFFWWNSLEDWSFFLFLFILLYAVMFYFLATMLNPHELESGFSFKSYFMDNRVWFFGTYAAAWSIDIVETHLKAEEGLRDVPEYYLIFVAVMIGFSIIGMITRNEKFHAFWAVLWPSTVLCFLGVSTLSRIAGH